LKKQLFKELESVYNRGFSTGFFYGRPGVKGWTDTYGSKAKTKKVYVGKVIHFYGKIGVAEVKIEARGLKIRDNLMIQGPTTGVYEEKIKSMEINHKKIKEVKKGKMIAIKLNSIVRKNDKVFVTIR